ncbi:MAG: hypothetical protein JSR48_07700, partial [Verrucomicrobia bacterium]|nr:hypothetical protein [Verrucomicrobiota bacterium]
MNGRKNPGFATRGFALLLVVLVLAFLTMLATSLALLAGRQSQSDAHREAAARARQHACLALRAALAQLQRKAGPDTRATANAGGALGVPGTERWTGVWDTADHGVAPLAWLVSGDGPSPLTAESLAGMPTIQLMSETSPGSGDGVVAPLQALTLPYGGPSGREPILGRYAWWMGDEGVKASIATAAGAAPLDELGRVQVEPRRAENAELLPRVTELEQLAWLRYGANETPLDGATLRSRRQEWTPRHAAVLSDPVRGGLKRDLSLQPGLLGRAFSAWAEPGTSMEDPAHPLTPRIAPDYGPVPLRRRYRMVAPIEDHGMVHSVAPVLSYFLLAFNLRTDPAGSGATRPLESRARWLVTLWNPYSSAMVPEDLSMEIEGLPALTAINDTNGTQSGPIALDHQWGTPLRIRLPWVADGRPDRQSWFPGRVHAWAARENLAKTEEPPAAGFDSVFYSRTLTTASGQGVQRSLTGSLWPTSATTHLVGAATQLTIRLYHLAPNGSRELLRSFVSPAFSAFVTPAASATSGTYQFSLVFHLAESIDAPDDPDAWLTTAGRDPREAVLGPAAFAPGANGPHPELYPNYAAASFPDRLLDRALPASAASTTGQSYNEDVPVFEMPRESLRSVGDLQHLALSGVRPFAVGNAWGAPGGWNDLFDRYFVTGLSTESVAAARDHLPELPNPGQVWAAPAGGRALPAVATAIAAARDGLLAGQLLQEGAFNVNSFSADAWHAFLRTARRDPGDPFRYVAAAVGTGTGSDDAESIDFADEAVFGRFDQSAPETYRTDTGYAASTTVPPAPPNVPSKANTHLFRQGIRVLTHDESGALAASIAELVRGAAAREGPFRSMADFLGPREILGGQSVLEAAIERAELADGRKLNDRSRVPEFSSQTLLPGDLMSRLAEYCTTRSDTFQIRVYGDAWNAATGSVSAQAWAEAVVQRLPEWTDPRQAPETAP